MKKRANVHRFMPRHVNPRKIWDDFFVPLIVNALNGAFQR